MARRRIRGDAGGVSGWDYAFGPGMALVTLAVLIVLMRWAFSSGSSVVARRPRSGTPQEYGLLVSIAAPNTYVEAELLRRRLEAAGIRATLATTTYGPRIMVFREDEARARRVLATH